MQILTADTGITVLYRHLPSRLSSLRYVVKCGAVDEQDKKEFGLCHALEHMYYSGTTSRSWEDIQHGFFRLGAYSNAYTAIPNTAYEVFVPSENFEASFEIAADMMYNPIFDEQRWEEVEKSAVMNELLGQQDDPMWVVQNAALVDAFGEDYHDPGGDIASVDQATVADLVNFSNRFYKGENVFISYAGGLSVKEVLDIVARHDKWNPERPDERVNKSYNFNGRDHHPETEGFFTHPLAHFLTILPYPRAEVDQYRYLVAESLLDRFLMQEIREKRGLSYGARAEVGFDLPLQCYLAAESSANTQEELDVLLEEMDAAIRRMPEEGADDDCIHQVTMDLYRDMLSSENCTQSFADDMANHYLADMEVCEADIVEKYLGKVSNDSIREVCKEFSEKHFKVTTLKEQDYGPRINF